MAEEMDQIVENLKQTSAWLRVVFMIGFAILLYLIVAPVLLVLMIVQALFTLITGESNQNLRYLGATLAQYVLQILEFISYNSETKPFPFTDFPSSESGAEANAEPAATTPKRKPAAAARKGGGTRKPKGNNGTTAASDTPLADD